MPEPDESESQYSDEELVCQCESFFGEVVSVTLVRSKGMIHFQNCYRRNWSLGVGFEPLFSCSIARLRHVRQLCHDGKYSLSITTEEGSATISAKASNYDELLRTLEAVIPPVPGLIRDYNDLMGVAGLSALGGAAVGFTCSLTLLPDTTSGTTMCIATVGGGLLVATLGFLLGSWILKRKYRR